MPDVIATFIDTGPWIALMDRRDEWHAAAVRTMDRLRAQKSPLVTSNLVLMEAYTALVGRIQRAAIARLRATIATSSYTRVERVDELTEELAWELFMRYDDKDASMVDCTSFAIMEQLGLSQAFTFDHHFEQVGFNIVPGITRGAQNRND
jgi:uncharacterized protein